MCEYMLSSFLEAVFSDQLGEGSPAALVIDILVIAFLSCDFVLLITVCHHAVHPEILTGRGKQFLIHWCIVKHLIDQALM
jgi:hypothetical protein